jgi:alpha-ketoglutarate-dependent taurine dioxygenase
VTQPTVTINQAAGQADPTNDSPIHFTVVFSENVTDFASGDVTITGTAPGTLVKTVTGSGKTYDVAVSGMTGSGTVIANVAAGVAHDPVGNASVASTSTDKTVTYDVTQPTVTINQAAGQADPTNDSPIHFTVVFSEPVTDFAASDVEITGTATGNLTKTVTGSGTTYDVAVNGLISIGSTTINTPGASAKTIAGSGKAYTGTASGLDGSGTVIANIPAGAAHDAAGNASVVSTSNDNTVTFDVTPPTVTIDQAVEQADPTNNGPIHFTVVFSEVVTDFAAADVTITGTAPGTLSKTVTGSGTTYDVAVDGMTDTGTVIANIASGAAHDAAGNASFASTSTDNIVTYDVTPLTVTINQSVEQLDPTDVFDVHFTVVFSQAVTDFDGSDIILSGSAPGDFVVTVTGSGMTYDVEVTGMTGNGTVIADLDAGVAHSAAGNPNLASTSDDNQITISGEVIEF